MTPRIRIRVGQVEVSYEGDEEYLREEVPALLERAVELAGRTQVTSRREREESASGASTGEQGQRSPGAPQGVKGLADEIGATVEQVVSAFAPSDEPPFLHLDRHHYSTFKQKTPKAGKNAIPAATLAGTLLALWFENRGAEAPTTEQVSAVLRSADIDTSKLSRALNNCEWLQLRNGRIYVKPTERKLAERIAGAFAREEDPWAQNG